MLAFTIAAAATALVIYMTTPPADLPHDLWTTLNSATWLWIGLKWKRRGR